MGALARMPAAQVVPLLLQALSSPDVVVKVRADRDARACCATRAARRRSCALCRDPRETVRRAAIKAVGEAGAEGAVDLLRAAIADESSLVRQQARAVAGRAAGPRDGRRSAAAARRPRPEDALRHRARARPGAQPRGGAAPAAAARRQAQGAALRRGGGARRHPRGGGGAAAHAVSWATPTAGLRRAAAESLGVIGDLQAVAPLLLALDDEHWSVRSRGRHRARPHPQQQGDAGRCWGGCADDDATRAPRRRARPWARSATRGRPGTSLHLLPRGGAAGDGARGAAAAGRRRPARARARLRGAPSPPRAACCSTSCGELEDRRARKLLLQALVRRQPGGAGGGGAGAGRGRLPGRGPAADAGQGEGSLSRSAAGGRRQHCASWRRASAPRMYRPTDLDVELDEEAFRLLRDLIHEKLRALLRRERSGPRCARGCRTALASRDLRASRTTSTSCASARSGPTSCRAWSAT